MRKRKMPGPRWFPNPYLGKALEGLNISNAQLTTMITQLADECVENFKLKAKNCDGGVYVGLAGLAYALAHAASKAALHPHRAQLLAQAQRVLEFHLEYAAKELRHTSRAEEAEFLLGNAGLNTVAAFVYHQLGDKGRARTFEERLRRSAAALYPLGAQNAGADEMFVGRAGMLCALLNLRLKVPDANNAKELATELVKATLESGRLGASHFPPGFVRPPLVYAYHGHHYLGAAHGTAAILQMLLSFPAVLKSQGAKAEAEVRASVDYFLSIQSPSGNFPSSMERIGDRARHQDDELWHWCHGAPGVIHLLIRAYHYFHDEKYLKGALAAGEGIWEKGLLKKGPGVCHGVAGNAYAFLLLHQTQPSEPKHLARAYAFTRFIQTEEFESRARTPDRPWSLFEGWAGTLCLYADLTDLARAEFPLFPAAAYP